MSAYTQFWYKPDQDIGDGRKNRAAQSSPHDIGQPSPAPTIITHFIKSIEEKTLCQNLNTNSQWPERPWAKANFHAATLCNSPWLLASRLLLLPQCLLRLHALHQKLVAISRLVLAMVKQPIRLIRQHGQTVLHLPLVNPHLAHLWCK